MVKQVAGMLVFVAYVGGETSAGMELKYELISYCWVIEVSGLGYLLTNFRKFCDNNYNAVAKWLFCVIGN